MYWHKVGKGMNQPSQTWSSMALATYTAEDQSFMQIAEHSVGPQY